MFFNIKARFLKQFRLLSSALVKSPFTMTGHCSHDTRSLKIASLTSIPINTLLIPQMEGKAGATSFLSGNQIAFQHTPPPHLHFLC